LYHRPHHHLIRSLTPHTLFRLPALRPTSCSYCNHVRSWLARRWPPVLTIQQQITTDQHFTHFIGQPTGYDYGADTRSSHLESPPNNPHAFIQNLPQMYAKQADALGYPNIVYVPTGSGQGPSSRVEARAPATEAAINNAFQDTCK
jgi:hypothetical protein